MSISLRRLGGGEKLIAQTKLINGDRTNTETKRNQLETFNNLKSKPGQPKFVAPKLPKRSI